MDGRGGKGGGKAGNTSMDWINSTLWVLMQFWRWGWEGKVNSIDCFDVATQFQIFYDYIWDDFIILLQIVWGEKKLENYIIIAKETDFWLPKQACMIVLLISCPSFPLSDLTYFFIHTYLISFFLFCLHWGFGFWGFFLVIVTVLTNSGKNSWLPALCSGGVWDAAMLEFVPRTVSDTAVNVQFQSWAEQRVQRDYRRLEIRCLLKLSKPTQPSWEENSFCAKTRE